MIGDRNCRMSGRHRSALLACLAASLLGLSLMKPAAAQPGENADERTKAEIARLKAEVPKLNSEFEKLNEEVRQLRTQNDAKESSFGTLAAYAGAIGGLVSAAFTLVIAWLGYWIPQQFNSARIQMLHQQHNLELFKHLASSQTRLQLAAAAALLQRISALPPSPREGSPQASEQKAIFDVLVAVIKEKPNAGEPAAAEVSTLSKYIGDNIIKALRATTANPDYTYASPLRRMDWQGAQLTNAFWKEVDARGVDFFGANFSSASLRGAHLRDAVLYQASLRGATLVGADLRGADLRGADLTGARLADADLTGAKLEGITYDGTTRWPAGFQPPPSAEQRAA